MQLLIDEQFLPAATELVKQACHHIYIATFKAEITAKPRGRQLKKFFDAVAEQSRLGVDTRLILNRVSKMGSVPITNLYVIKELPKQGIPIHCLPYNRISHAKLLIVDEFAAIVGSHNLSVKSCHSNFEVSCLTKDPYVVGQLRGIFEQMWENTKEA